MHNRRPRSFRRRSNGRDFRRRSNDNDSNRLVSGSFASVRGKNNFKPQQSAEKLLESYKTLAKEAISSGDKTLAENYLQHADHFMRIVEDKNRSQSQGKTNLIHKTTADEKNLSQKNDINQDQVTNNNKE